MLHFSNFWREEKKPGEETKVHQYNTLGNTFVYTEQHLFVHITFVANAVVSRFASSWADTTKRF